MFWAANFPSIQPRTHVEYFCLVILAASVFEISRGKQTNTQTAVKPTLSTAVSVGE